MVLTQSRDVFLKYLAVALLFASVSVDAIAQRYVPGCYREQAFMERDNGRTYVGAGCW